MATPLSILSEKAPHIDAVAEWRSLLTALTGGVLLFETITGVALWLLPFSEANQLGLLLHTVAGLVMAAPVAWYATRHWWVRRGGNLSHYQLLGYVAVALLALCALSGAVVTWQAAATTRLSYLWDAVHLATGLALAIVVVAHLVTVASRGVGSAQPRELLAAARRRFYQRTAMVTVALTAVWGGWVTVHQEPSLSRPFPADYAWRFGEDRPFAPSLARLDSGSWGARVQQEVLALLASTGQEGFRAALAANKGGEAGLFTRIRNALDGGAMGEEVHDKVEAIFATAAQEVKAAGSIDPRALAGSEGCGSAGCHQEIYEEWLPSAHRYSSLDDMFQRVQAVMAKETSPETTRYCAGCHDPISLFSGAKDAGNITLSAEGSQEGSSCLVCHSIVQTDVQGNGDYTVQIPQRYLYELDEGPLAKFVSDFLIRAYPEQHLRTYSRSLYKTPEFCAACHKQYIDKSVNVDIGKVQGQNQYDSWKSTRWYHEGDLEQTITCRECHMPLVESHDPARGDGSDYNRAADDRKHRSHSIAAANQYIPLSQNLKGGEEQARRVAQWLRGELEIPEIAHKWTSGPVVRMEIDAPDEVASGEEVTIHITLTNNKAGHGFPTGPLDMIESWVELAITDGDGKVVHHQGAIQADGHLDEPVVVFKADGFDRSAKPIDRHNLWDLVGASYKRTLYPGMADAVEAQFQCPSMARGRITPGDAPATKDRRSETHTFEAPMEGGELTATAHLWYRKANPEFLDTVYGAAAGVRSPITEITRATTTIRVAGDVVATAR